MIVDIGCPKSLMGSLQWENLLTLFSEYQLSMVETEETKASFKFGPSKTYTAKTKVYFPLALDGVIVQACFHIIEGNIPILLGNDILKPAGANISVSGEILTLNEISEQEIRMFETKGGHLAIRLLTKDENEEVFSECETSSDENVTGVAADKVMIIALEESIDEHDINTVHDMMGHENFVYLTLTEDEEKEIVKAHRYFGHRSGRKICEMFS